MKKEKTFEDLLDEALENAKSDRALAKDAFDKMRQIFDKVDVDDASSLQGVMLTGQQAVKLLESMSRSNEQILKAATLKQKDKPKLKEEDDEPFDIETIKAAQSTNKN